VTPLVLESVEPSKHVRFPDFSDDVSNDSCKRLLLILYKSRYQTMNSNLIGCSTYLVIDSLQTVCEDGEFEESGRWRASRLNTIWHDWKALSGLIKANISTIKAAARNSLGRDSVSKRLYATNNKGEHHSRVRKVEERAAEYSGISKTTNWH
jgi:hypothetical protein